MTVVVDLGCEPHGEDFSIEPLAKRFEPDLLLGFDPAAAAESYVLPGTNTEVVIDASAAWVYDGTLQFSGVGDSATTMLASNSWNGTERAVPCFDFSALLSGLENAVVKMDIEGAELPILEKVIADGTDDRISLLIVEWHEGMFDGPSFARRRKRIEAALRCPVEIWP